MQPSTLIGSRSLVVGVLALALALVVGLGCTSAEPVAERDDGLTGRAADVEAGRHALLNNGVPGAPMISCGLPYSLWKKVRGLSPDDTRIPGREGHNADLPYYLSTATTSRGVEVVSANCLFCHGGKIEDQLIIGLGDSMRDFTYSGAIAGPVQEVAAKVVARLTDISEDEQAELQRFLGHMEVTAKFVQTDTIGVNPAATMFGLFAAFRNPITLEARAEPDPKMKLWVDGELAPLVSDVPSWWTTAKKKKALYYGGFGVKDHARLMMNASLLCLENVEEAKAIDAYFGDIRAYILSIDPPKYPRAIDAAEAERGAAIFESKCEGCHGSPAKENSYTDRVVPLRSVGTDARYNDIMSGEFGQRSMEWFNRSWWGTNGHASKMELPVAPGYIAPPLDGIWATAPYLHNGSIPTLEALLDSSKRPRVWERSFDTRDFDFVNVGWNYTEHTHDKGHILNLLARERIYDTSRPGFSNAGHTYSDDLSPLDRRALIEHMKTF